MAAARTRPRGRRLIVATTLLAVLPLGATAAGDDNGHIDSDGTPAPAYERLSYSVAWAGIHCGEIEITSFREAGPGGEVIERVAVLMRTTRFFDGIYRVRSRLDSFYDPSRMTSIRYEERSQEKKKRKVEFWRVDHEAGEVIRTKNGETSRMALGEEKVLDPLAFIMSLRRIGTEVGAEGIFELMTSKGPVSTVARATKQKDLKTKSGRCDATAIVPEVGDELMFSHSGAMVVWVDRREPHRPCRIEFDLSFGKLVANLKAVEVGVGEAEIDDWETWGR